MRKAVTCLNAIGVLVLALCVPISAQNEKSDPAAQNPTAKANLALVPSTALATLRPIGNSGINATLNLADDLNTLIVTGVGTGLDPSKTYVSLVYDRGSVPTGPNACLPTDNSLSFSQMVIAYWLPVGKSNRYLLSVKGLPANSTDLRAYAPLNGIGTISIREDTQPNLPLPSVPDPNRFQLRACGAVQRVL